MSAERGVINPPVTITLAGKQVDGLIYAVGHASTDQGVVKITVREPDSYMGWIEVDGDGHHFAVWRPTGAVYTVGADGAVGDDPVWGTTG